jgi:hypothetical protein
MGLTYSFQLCFEAHKVPAVLRDIARFAERKKGRSTRLRLPDGGVLKVPFEPLVPGDLKPWGSTGQETMFEGTFRFPWDEALLKYSDDIGDIKNEASEPALYLWLETIVGKRYACFSFVASTSAKSRLFLESRSIHTRFFQLLTRHEGVMGVLDVESNRWFLLPSLTECIEVHRSDLESLPDSAFGIDAWMDLVLSREIQPTVPPLVYLQQQATLEREAIQGIGLSFREVLACVEAATVPPTTSLEPEARAAYELGLDRVDVAYIWACGDPDNAEQHYRHHTSAALAHFVASQSQPYFWAGVAYMLVSASYGFGGLHQEMLDRAQDSLDRARRIVGDRIEINAIQLFIDLRCGDYDRYLRDLRALGTAAAGEFRVQLAKLHYAIWAQRDQAYRQYELALGHASNDNQRLAAHMAILANPVGILRRSASQRTKGVWTVSEEMLARQRSEPEIWEQIMAIVGELPSFKQEHERVSKLLSAQVPVTD